MHSDEVFDALDTLVEEERVAAYGVSVETCEEALTAIARPNVASVQLILNPFRMKPLREVLPAVTPQTEDIARQLAELPLEIKGFGFIKEAAAEAAAARRAELLAAFRAGGTPLRHAAE